MSIINTNIKNCGENNRFIVIKQDGSVEENPCIKGLTVRFLGNNAKIVFYAPLPTFLNCYLNMGDNSEFVMESSPYKVKNLIVSKMKSGCKIKIGKNFSCEELEIPMHGETNLTIHIGDNCMFSHHISMYVSDFHGIYDINTKEPINFGKNIYVGNHVWLGAHVTLLKKTHINDNSVVGINSICTKEYPGNSIIAGSPAKVIRENINWSRDNCQYLKKRGIDD